MKSNIESFNKKNFSSEQLISLREHLKKNNGINDLQFCKPTEIEKAKRLFYKDGFVLVTDALKKGQLEFIKSGSERVINEMLLLDKKRVGNRGSHRYSFGGASKTGHLLHNPEWAMLIDLDTVTPILTSIFGSKITFLVEEEEIFVCQVQLNIKDYIQIWVTGKNVSLKMAKFILLDLLKIQEGY